MEPQQTDQERFDEAVNRKGKVVLEVLAGAGILAAVLMSMVALIQSADRHEAKATAQSAAMQVTATPAASKPVAASVLDVKIVPSFKVGPGGKRHDAFTQTEFSVKVGQPLTLKIDNTDNAPHSITSPVAGVNIISQPGMHTYTLLVSKAGRFEWTCMVPCDSDAGGWAMQHPGYMSGYITAA